jgi:hypothetical protein
MRRRRRRRRLLLLLAAPAVDISILLVLGASGIIGLIYWPDHYLAALAIPIALIILFAKLRWG